MILTTALVLTSFGSLALAQESAADSSGWRFRAVPYLWMAGQTGKMGLRGGDGTEVEAEFEDIIKNLEFGFMAVLEAGKGQWSVLLDGMFVNLSRDSLGTSDKTTIEARQVTVDAAAVFRFRNPEYLGLYAGVRYNSIETEVEHNDGTLAKANQAWVDPIAGVRLRWDFASGWLIGGKADVGGFGLASDFTWQIVPAAGYQLSRTWAVLLAYRYLSINYEDESEGFLYDVNTGGFALGVEISF